MHRRIYCINSNQKMLISLLIISKKVNKYIPKQLFYKMIILLLSRQTEKNLITKLLEESKIIKESNSLKQSLIMILQII